MRRWYLQAQVDSGQRRGATSEELAEIKELKARVRRLEDDNDILGRATIFFAGELDPRRPWSAERRRATRVWSRVFRTGSVTLTSAAWRMRRTGSAIVRQRYSHP